MSRVPRESLNSKYFHVIVQGIEKKYIFNNYRYKEKYRNLLIENLKKQNVELLAYCIMDNHAHMLIYSEKIIELSAYMQRVNTSFAVYYNKSKGRVGYLFRERFRSVPIKSDKQLYRTLIYIHLNPIAAQICNYPEKYYFSSYNDYCNKRGIVTDNVLERMKFEKNNYKKTFQFIHYFPVKGHEFDEMSKKRVDLDRIEEYIEENKIVDIVFQSDKVKKMVEDLKKENISFTRIAEYLEISNQRLKMIISD